MISPRYNVMILAASLCLVQAICPDKSPGCLGTVSSTSVPEAHVAGQFLCPRCDRDEMQNQLQKLSEPPKFYFHDYIMVNLESGIKPFLGQVTDLPRAFSCSFTGG